MKLSAWNKDQRVDILLHKTSFAELQSLIEPLYAGDRNELKHELEAISLKAGMVAAYIDMRHGFGCGDQGHKDAVKNMNKIGKAIWCKAFGYNGHMEVNI